MSELTPRGKQIVEDLAQRYGISIDAVLAMLQALIKGNSTMAQFNHPDFGGSGQWMRGGMIMVGDMFNNALKAKVDGLCNELSNHLVNEPFFARPTQSQSQSQTQSGSGTYSLFVSGSRQSGNWWPEELGSPSATGAQNQIRYAFFPGSRRLAIDIDGRVTIYDTQDHHISGVSQQQGSNATLTFTSQHGLVRLTDLPVVSTQGQTHHPSDDTSHSQHHHVSSKREQTVLTSPPPQASGPPSEEDVIGKLERLSALRDKGILSEEEFAAKKAELLARI